MYALSDCTDFKLVSMELLTGQFDFVSSVAKDNEMMKTKPDIYLQRAE